MIYIRKPQLKFQTISVFTDTAFDSWKIIPPINKLLKDHKKLDINLSLREYSMTVSLSVYKDILHCVRFSFSWLCSGFRNSEIEKSK